MSQKTSRKTAFFYKKSKTHIWLLVFLAIACFGLLIRIGLWIGGYTFELVTVLESLSIGYIVTFFYYYLQTVLQEVKREDALLDKITEIYYETCCMVSFIKNYSNHNLHDNLKNIATEDFFSAKLRFYTYQGKTSDYLILIYMLLYIKFIFEKLTNIMSFGLKNISTMKTYYGDLLKIKNSIEKDNEESFIFTEKVLYDLNFIILLSHVCFKFIISSYSDHKKMFAAIQDKTKIYEIHERRQDEIMRGKDLPNGSDG